MPKVDIPGLAMHAEMCGQGAPLLLIPGALGTGAGDFQAQIEWFAARRFAVVAPDPRGYGGSRPPQREYPLDFYHGDSADMFALMSALGHEQFSIIRWSDGANIGAIMAATRPDRVSRLVVFGGQSFLTAGEITALGNIHEISAWSPRSAAAMRVIYGDDLDALWNRYIDGQEALFAAGGDLYAELLAKVACPVLVLHGAKDPLVPRLHPEAIHHAIAGSRLHIFPDGKHNIHLKYPDEFNALVLAFLTEPDRS